MDARFIAPLNVERIAESVAKTGKLLLASDACERNSFLHTIASQVSQIAFDELDGPPVVVGSRNWITPAVELEPEFFPQKEWIIDALHERLLPLPGHEVTTVQSGADLARRYREGV
jgi:2-oxoisovalerate dehydrogenase E1 component